MKGGLQKVASVLNANLARPFIFYIPKEVISEDKIADFNIPFSESDFNKLKIIDKNGGIDWIGSNTQLIPILEKASILDNNMFLLLESKEKYTESQFQYLTQKYFTNLNFYVYISQWMVKNLERCIETIPAGIKANLEIQRIAFENHQVICSKHFQLPPIKEDSLIRTWQSIDQVFPIYKNPNPNTNQVKAQPLLSDMEARAFLLETVFQVNV